MTIIRQPSLFGIQELYEMEPPHRYEALSSTIDLDVIYHEINKKSRLVFGRILIVMIALMPNMKH